jgi:hypothetical protein
VATETSSHDGTLHTGPGSCVDAQILSTTVSCTGRRANFACSQGFECPVGQQVRALKLACHLNAGKVTSGMLAGLAWPTMAAVSAPVGGASCLVDGQDLQADATQVPLTRQNRRRRLRITGIPPAPGRRKNQ